MSVMQLLGLVWFNFRLRELTKSSGTVVRQSPCPDGYRDVEGSLDKRYEAVGNRSFTAFLRSG